MKDLPRNTRPQLMRTSLGQPTGRLQDPRFASGRNLGEGDLQARQKVIEDVLKEVGVDTSAEGVKEAIDDLVTEGPYDWHEGVQLDVLFYSVVADVVPSARSDSDPEAGKERVLESPNRTSC